MSHHLSSPAVDPQGAPEYGPLGLNHVLLIDDLLYTFDPERRHWVHDDWTPRGTYTPDLLSAEEIHALVLEGRFRVLPWIEGTR